METKEIYTRVNLRKWSEMVQEHGGKGLSLLLFVLSIMDNENTFIMTQTEIADAAGISRTTVSIGIQFLIDVGIIKRQHTYYMISPDFACKCSNQRREFLSKVYTYFPRYGSLALEKELCYEP